jgi:hypothetical protein
MKKDNIRKISSVLVYINITRYEDTGKKYENLQNAESSVVAYADKLIAGKEGLAGVASSIDLVDVHSEDNGKECDGEDIGRWSVHLKYLARFELAKPASYAEGFEQVISIIDDFTGDTCEDSLEEYACDFDVSPAHLPCRIFPPQE